MAINEILYQKLIEAAKSRQTITYGEVLSMFNMNTSSPAHRSMMGWMLAEISKHETAEGRPMLSVLVVLPDTGIPDVDTFALASELGLHKSGDDQGFFEGELKRVFAYWGE
jgi:hypothetical protein